MGGKLRLAKTETAKAAAWTAVGPLISELVRLEGDSIVRLEKIKRKNSKSFLRSFRICDATCNQSPSRWLDAISALRLSRTSGFRWRKRLV